MRIKREKTSVWIILVLVAALILTACGDDDKEEKKSYTVGIVNPNPVAKETVDAFKVELTARGYTEGQNITYIEVATTADLTEQVSADQVDLLFIVGGTFSGAPTNMLTQTKTLAAGKIPIVVGGGSGDPLKAGDIESIAHPGKNITGLLLPNVDVKRFDLFVDMLPDDAESVAVVYDLTNPNTAEQLPEIETLAEREGLQLIVLSTPFAEPEMLEQAFADIPDDVDGLFLLKVWGSSPRWYQWAYERGIPTSQDGRYAVEMPQPLMVYGPSTVEIGTRAANFAAQILKGTKPGELPMEYTEPILVIDLGIAEGMGFEVPDASLNLANEILHSDPSLLFTAPAPADAGTVTHPAGSGACATRQVSMGGGFAACITAACDTLLDSGIIRYEDRQDVASCTTENLVGTCQTSAFDIHYYEGEASSLKIGCGFQSGKWVEPGR